MNGFQIMPDLNPEEYHNLKQDIAERGVLVPVEYDEDGNILDGHHRVRICRELGIATWPKIIRQGLSGSEKRIHARQLNVARRHLSRDQRQDLIRKQLKETPEKSSNMLAKALGVSDKTVTAQRKHMESTSEIPKLDKTTGADGKTRKKSYRFVDDSPEGQQAIQRESSRIRRERKQRQKEEKSRLVEKMAADVPAITDRYRLFQADIASLDEHLEPGSVDCILTDPPYPREYLPLYGELARMADLHLKPGGSCLVMCGQSYLPEILERMASHLTYHWTVAYLTPGGQASQLWEKRVNTFWKPVLWFVKPSRSSDGRKDWIGDVSKSAGNDNDKRFHHWGQSESGMADLIERFTHPGEIILDPFLGGGATGVVAVSLKRRFIGCDIDPKAIETALARFDTLSVEVGHEG